MNLNTKKENLAKTLRNIDKKEDFEHDARMIMYRFLSEVERITDEEKISRKSLAGMIGTSASYITQLFRGNKLINMLTLAKIQKKLNIKFEIKAISAESKDIYTDLDINTIASEYIKPEGTWVWRNFSSPAYDHNKPFVKSPFVKISEERISA